MKYYEYESWARVTLHRDPERTDWEHMTINEAARRAIAICDAAKESVMTGTIVKAHAFRHLEKFAESLAERYGKRK